MLAAVAERARVVQPEKSQGQALRVVPILGPNHEEPPYELLRPETLDKVVITEVSDAGSVPVLRVQNQLDVRVFLMDGQELIGAKQNRILNTDVMVPAGASLNIPVSCVEAGRWHHATPSFSIGKTASHRVRSGKQRRVHASLRATAKFDAQQAQVWDEVDLSLAFAKVESSPTRALADAYAAREREMSQFRSELRMPERAVGVAVFHGCEFKGLDLFDRHSTLQRFWDSLIDSYAIDFLDAPIEIGQSEPTPEENEVRSILSLAATGGWERFDSPGQGTDWRLDSPGLSGSALLWEDRVVLHLQLFPNQWGQAADLLHPGRIRRNLRPRRAV